MIVGQIIVQGMLSQQQKNLEIVSLIEQRQILCQQVIKLAVLSKLKRQGSDRQQKIQELRKLQAAWVDSGEKLIMATQNITGFSETQKETLQNKLKKNQNLRELVFAKPLVKLSKKAA
ncbi:MAG: hypothetical protein HC908_09395 [Calothrix sp. SM1_7_51]|nr:hypothetical protein [Calothrix sp. SM1_7_51]